MQTHGLMKLPGWAGIERPATLHTACELPIPADKRSMILVRGANPARAPEQSPGSLCSFSHRETSGSRG